MINLRKTSAQHVEKAYSKNDLKKGIVINCKHSKKDFEKAQESERINYIRQFGMGDKRNWGQQ